MGYWTRPGLSFPLQRALAPLQGVTATFFGHEHALKENIRHHVCTRLASPAPGENCRLSV